MKRILASMTLGLATLSWPILSEAGACRVHDANVRETKPVVGAESTDPAFANCLRRKTSRSVWIVEDMDREFGVICSFKRSAGRQFRIPDEGTEAPPDIVAATWRSFKIGLGQDLRSARCQLDLCDEKSRIGISCDAVATLGYSPLSGTSQSVSLHGPNAVDCNVLTSASDADCHFTFGDYDRLTSLSEVETIEPFPQFDQDADFAVVLTQDLDPLNILLSLFDLACAGSGFVHRLRLKTA